MNNDLISRSELKKAIEELEITEELVDYDCDDVSTTGVSQYLDRPDVLGLIDNAPTVEPEKAKEGELVKAYTKGFDAGVETARPKGEWKEFKYGLYYCSRCFERVDKDIERIDALVSKGERSNYCPACGAKMGGTT